MTVMYNSYESFKKYAVKDVSTVEEFLQRYYKRDRFTGRGDEYARALLQSHRNHFERNGYDIISRHDSNTGDVVSFYGSAP